MNTPDWKREDRREVKFTAKVDRATHVVHARWGRASFLRKLGIAHVGILFRWNEGEGRWELANVNLISGGGLNDPMVRLEDLRETPEWLKALLDRAWAEVNR